MRGEWKRASEGDREELGSVWDEGGWTGEKRRAEGKEKSEVSSARGEREGKERELSTTHRKPEFSKQRSVDVGVGERSGHGGKAESDG